MGNNHRDSRSKEVEIVTDKIISSVQNQTGIETGMSVRHKRYGLGTVVRFENEGKIIVIQFETGLMKSFPYPEAYNNKFLELQ